MSGFTDSGVHLESHGGGGDSTADAAPPDAVVADSSSDDDVSVGTPPQGASG